MAPAPPAVPRQAPPPDRSSVLVRGLPSWAMLLAGLAALASLLAQHGFHPDPAVEPWLDRLDFAIAAAFGLDLLLCLARNGPRLAVLRRRWFEFALLALLVLSLTVLAELGPALHLGARTLPKLYLAVVEAFLLGMVVVRVLRTQERLLERRFRPEALLVASFAALALAGTALLLLPRARAAGAAPLTPVDALFTATSAACVTGLVVRDTGSELSQLGQWIVLALFQVGGLGIVTFVAAGQVFSARSLSIPQQALLKEVLATRNLADVRRHVRAVVVLAVGVELLGALLLFLVHPGFEGSAGARAFWSLFHAVSAFCNAGFALQADSLESLRGAAGVNLVVVALIVVGGLGLPVVRNLAVRARVVLAHRLARRRGRYAPRPRVPRLTVQTRLTLWITGGLLVVGVGGFLALEWTHALAGMPAGERLLAGLFQGVTPRTAGFDTVPMAELRGATRVLVMALMAVGAGPISTGGGIKTVTLALLFVTLRAMLQGRDDVESGGRTIPRRVVRAALSVFVTYLALGVVVVFLLALCEPALAFDDLCFEAWSALGTVGLSTGVTAELGTASKLVLCAAMLVGRVGPLALALSVFRGRGPRAAYRYPEEDLIVG